MLDMRRVNHTRREISMVPLINVVFLLLIYFLVAGTLDKIEIITIDPPDAESGKILDEGHIVILLGKYDEVILDDELVTMDDLVPMITQKLEAYPDKIITLKPDQDVPAQRLIQVMDLVKEAGGYNLSLVTQEVS